MQACISTSTKLTSLVCLCVCIYLVVAVVFRIRVSCGGESCLLLHSSCTFFSSFKLMSSYLFSVPTSKFLFTCSRSFGSLNILINSLVCCNIGSPGCGIHRASVLLDIKFLLLPVAVSNFLPYAIFHSR